jgi:hypothetical protein
LLLIDILAQHTKTNRLKKEGTGRVAQVVEPGKPKALSLNPVPQNK